TDPASPPDNSGDVAPISKPPVRHHGAAPIEGTSSAEFDPKPITPEGRVDRWHRKLLDLTLRNRLLNFRSTKQTIPFLCPEISKLEDLLARGSRLKLVSLTDAKMDRRDDPAVSSKVAEKELQIQFAKDALEHGQVCATIAGQELTKRLTTLYRSSRNDLAEGGSNTLYLAVGFLWWKENPTDSRVYRAPLLLVPVKLIRKSAHSAYRLAHHEDDVRFNATLIQKLKRDFDCDLTRFEAELPKDDRGIDVPMVLDSVRHAIRKLSGFEVVDETSLATFSFAKYLMWKDLVERSDQLEQNRVVRHLVRDPDKAFQSDASTSIPTASEMDQRFNPAQLIHPLDADSTQLAAVMAAAEGHDFVLVGPPGTGKSQTIANMIAQCLAGGKTVLFVAEKTAALDVVQRRLEQNGLGDFCVELHSNKAERKRFLRQLDQAWQHGGRKRGTNWKRINKELQLSRDQLNAYVESLHRKSNNGWTPYQAIGVSVSGQTIETPVLNWPDHQQHDEAAYETLEKVADEIALTFSAVSRQEPFDAVTKTNWSMEWEQNLLDHSGRLERAIEAFRPALKLFCQTIGLQCEDGSID
ncbi:MAG: DUF4011 domain-containing protein, partial [Planctomycetales bacterium]|nr:DUF4011 domain-containing protein [Planctomycetales bacterium]